MGKKGGKSPKKGRSGSPKGGKKSPTPAGDGPKPYVDYTRWVKPPTPEPKDYDLPNEVEVAARNGDIDRIKFWLEEQNGHVDAQWYPDVSWRVTTPGNFGCTMLQNAAANRGERLVVYLIDKGASLDLQDANGETALMLAAKSRMRGYGHHDASDRIVITLLKHGASTTLTNKDGRNAKAIINPVLLGGVGGLGGPISSGDVLPPQIMLAAARPRSASASYLRPTAVHSTPGTQKAPGLATSQRYLDRAYKLEIRKD